MAEIQRGNFIAKGSIKSSIGISCFNGLPMYPPPVFSCTQLDLLNVLLTASVQWNHKLLNTVGAQNSASVAVALLLQAFMGFEACSASSYPSSKPIDGGPISYGKQRRRGHTYAAALAFLRRDQKL